MEIFLEFAENIGLGAIGLLIYSLFEARKYLSTWSWRKFFSGNQLFWSWAVSLQVLFAGLLAIKPEAASALKTITALDFTDAMAFVVSGMGLSHAANLSVKEKKKE